MVIFYENATMESFQHLDYCYSGEFLKAQDCWHLYVSTSTSGQCTFVHALFTYQSQPCTMYVHLHVQYMSALGSVVHVHVHISPGNVHAPTCTCQLRKCTCTYMSMLAFGNLGAPTFTCQLKKCTSTYMSISALGNVRAPTCTCQLKKCTCTYMSMSAQAMYVHLHIDVSPGNVRAPTYLCQPLAMYVHLHVHVSSRNVHAPTCPSLPRQCTCTYIYMSASSLGL